MSEKIERRHEWVTPNGAKFVIEEFCADGYPEHTVSIDGGDRRPLSAGLYWKIKSDSEALEAEKAENERLRSLIGRITSNPRWCSIGSINNIVEVRIDSGTYNEARKALEESK